MGDDNLNIQPDGNDIILENLRLRQRIADLETSLISAKKAAYESESQLKQKEQDYLDIIDSSIEGSFICDLVENEIHFSGEWKKRLGIASLSPREATVAYRLCTHPDDIEGMQKAWLEAVETKSPRVRMEFRARTVDSGYIWILGQAKITYDQDGTPIKYIGTHIDITDLKKSQEILESEERLSALMNFSPCLVFLKDVQGRYVYVNETYEKKFVGTTDWYGKTDFDFWAKESAELFQGNDNLVLSSGEVHQFLEDSTDIGGTRFCWLCYKFPFTDSLNRKYLAGIGIDATQLVLTEEALRHSEEAVRQSEERYRNLIESSPAAIYEIDPQNERFTLVNDSVCALTGYSREELMAMNPMDILDEDSQAAFADRAREWLAGVKPDRNTEYKITCKDGRVIDALLNTSFQIDEAGKPILATVISQDITERIRAEKALEESEKRYRHLVKYAPTGIYEIDFRQQRFISVNDAMCQVTGYSPEELLNMNPIGLMDDQSKVLFQTRLKQWLSGQKPEDMVDYLIKTKGGRWIWANLNVSFTFDENGQPFGAMVVSNDVTRRKLAEIALEDSERLYRAVFDNNEDAFALIELVYDANGRPSDYKVLDVNGPFEMQIGLQAVEIIGKTSREIPFVVEPDWFSTAEKVLKTGNPVINERYSKQVDKWYEIRTFPYSPNVFGQISRDITRKKKAELEIARLDRLNLIGEMAAGIGHEIRNPMTSVRGFLQMLGGKKEYEADQEFFSLMIEELNRANEIITEFLSLAKNKRVELRQHSLDSIIKALYPFMMSDANIREINLSLELNSPPYVMVDAGEIRQLILNMVRNGLEAIHHKGSLIIGAGYKNNEVILYIEDDGPGLPPELSDKIGTPFLTTKDSGTGLGLAVCYSIAARNNAKIDYETGPAGTTFFVRFPVKDE